ncbi:hypothetical protein V1264_002507 [Littorina saxatilis]|uniref:Uncharacterized protein n=1 Tax=Littorina saxatilis TaxID=31220 RepID=A0AAN9G7U6_9CAEN
MQADMLAGLPWLGFPICGFVTSRTVDTIRQKNVISTTKLRKIADGFAKVVPMLQLVCMVCLPDGQVAALSVLEVLCIVLMSLEGSSWVANIVDITSQYAGFVSSVAQVLSLPGSILLPLLVQFMTPHVSTLYPG